MPSSELRSLLVRVHMNKMDRVPYTVFAEFTAEWASVLGVPLIQTENTNKPDKHSRNTQTEASDPYPYTQEQGNIQHCAPCINSMVCSSLSYLLLHFQIPISSLSTSPDSLLVPQHCAAQYFFYLHFFLRICTACILYLVLPVVSIYIVKVPINYFTSCTLGMFAKQILLKGLPGEGVSSLARNHLRTLSLQSSMSAKAPSSVSMTAHGGCNTTWSIFLKISTFPVLCMHGRWCTNLHVISLSMKRSVCKA